MNAKHEVINILEKIVSLTHKEIEEALEIPPQPEFGDLAFPCFDLAKKEKRAPQQIAQQIVEKIKIPKGGLVSSVEAKAGYVNFFFRWEGIAEQTLKQVLARKERFGKPEKIERKKIMVEHTSVNPNKALHIGHTRNSCLGDSLARILSFCGHDVEVANYIDDTGAQVADIIVGFKFLGMPLKTEKKFDRYCGDDVYVKVNNTYETDSGLLEKKKLILKKIEEGKNEIADFSQDLVKKILLEQLKTCWRMDIFYDLINKESDIIHLKLWENVFESLKNKNLVYRATEGEKNGCWLLKLSDLPEFRGMKNADLTLIRSDGTVVYVGKDIPYAMWKHGLSEQDFGYKKLVTQPNKKTLWTTTIEMGEKEHPDFKGVDISINVIDVRQSYYQDSVMAALKLISGKPVEYTHYDYELVSLSSKTAKELGIGTGEKGFIHMAGRKGWFINTDVVLDALFDKALKETKKRNPDLDEKALKEIAEAIAISALKYELIKISPEKMIVFDLDEALKLEGDTASYLQYACTRCYGILGKAGKWKPNYGVEKLTEHEIKLIKLLNMGPEVIASAATDLRPHYVCNYAYDIVDTFNTFYQFCPVLQAETEGLKNFRLTLVESTRIVLENVLGLMGLRILKKM